MYALRMTDYRWSPVDHATIDDTMDRLEAARRALCYDDDGVLTGEPSRQPTADDVLHAGDLLSDAIEALSAVMTEHDDETEEREKAAAIKASEQAELDQWEAEDRDKGL